MSTVANITQNEVYEIFERLGVTAVIEVQGEVVLDHLQRERGRLKVRDNSGAQLRVFLERGKVLAIGEILRSSSGHCFRVCAADEPVIRAEADDWLLFARACYHLGNRHVKMQLGERWLRITPDHVLRDMLEQLGLRTREECAPFVPESGAYAGGGHHEHEHEHDHHGHHH